MFRTAASGRQGTTGWWAAGPAAPCVGSLRPASRTPWCPRVPLTRSFTGLMAGSLLCPKAPPVTPQMESRYLHGPPGTITAQLPTPVASTALSAPPRAKDPTMALGSWALLRPAPPTCSPHHVGTPRMVPQMLSLQALGHLDAPHTGAPGRRLRKGRDPPREGPTSAGLGFKAPASASPAAVHCPRGPAAPQSTAANPDPPMLAARAGGGTGSSALHGATGPWFGKLAPSPAGAPPLCLLQGPRSLLESGKQRAGAAQGVGTCRAPPTAPPQAAAGPPRQKAGLGAASRCPCSLPGRRGRPAPPQPRSRGSAPRGRKHGREDPRALGEGTGTAIP